MLNRGAEVIRLMSRKGQVVLALVLALTLLEEFMTPFLLSIYFPEFVIRFEFFHFILIHFITFSISVSTGLRYLQVLRPRRHPPRCYEPLSAAPELVRTSKCYLCALTMVIR